MSSGAYRDAGAAIERAEALEREVEELREELAKLREASGGRTSKTPTRPPPDVARLENELVDLRAENELLRSQLKSDVDGPRAVTDLRRQLAAANEERRELEASHQKESAMRAAAALERDALEREVLVLRVRVDDLATALAKAREQASLPPPAPPPPPSRRPKAKPKPPQPAADADRDALVARMRDELVELRTHNELLRSAIAKLEGRE